MLNVFYQESDVNKNQIKGGLKEAAGKIQQAAGKAVGSHEQQRKGLKKQADGLTQRTAGDITEVVKDLKK